MKRVEETVNKNKEEVSRAWACHVVGPWKPVHESAFQDLLNSNEFDN